MYVTQDQFDQGLRALDRFRKLITTRYRPVLRAATGNETLQVAPISSGAFTDGKVVYLPVPLALGDETLEHDKSLCGTRKDDTLEMLCPMCYVEDLTDGLVFHESAHITEGSFAKLNHYKVVAIVKNLFGSYLDGLDPDRRKAIMDKINSADTAMQVAGALDTWLPYATNVVEDIYVNRRLFEYRLGVEVPMRVHSRRVFEHGIEEASTGALHQWRDNDKDAQAIISAYLIGQNLTEFAVHLDPACDLTGDQNIKDLVGSIPSDCDVEVRLEIASKLLLYLRSLGFCPPPKDSIFTPPPPTPGPQGQSEPQPSPPQEAQPQPPEPGQGGQGEDEGGEEQEADGDGEGSEGGDDKDGKTGKAGQAGDDDDADGQESGEGSGKGEDNDDGDDASSGGDDDQGSEPESGEGEGSDGDTQDEGTDSEGGRETNKQSGATPNESDNEPFEPPTDAEIEESARRAKELLTYIMGHEDSGPTGTSGQGSDEMILERVIKQEGFDHPSEMVGEYDLVTRDKEPYGSKLNRVKRVEVPRHMLTPSLARLRVVFASNRKTGIERSLRSGSRLDTMHLYRAGTDDPRIFGKRNVPKARDWFVLVGLDFSSSTLSNGADYAEKMAGHAIGDLLHQLGIRFSMYAHTSGSGHPRTLEHVVIKAPDENWKTKGVQETLFAQKGRATNLDGHSLEQYRKLILQERATDKMVMYFTDGEMPCANFDEELELLKENIAILRRHRVHLVGCGYRTDSPKYHGLDTIQYDEPNDVAALVKGLEERLLQRYGRLSLDHRQGGRVTPKADGQSRSSVLWVT